MKTILRIAFVLSIGLCFLQAGTMSAITATLDDQADATLLVKQQAAYEATCVADATCIVQKVNNVATVQRLNCNATKMQALNDGTNSIATNIALNTANQNQSFATVQRNTTLNCLESGTQATAKVIGFAYNSTRVDQSANIVATQNSNVMAKKNYFLQTDNVLFVAQNQSALNNDQKSASLNIWTREAQQAINQIVQNDNNVNTNIAGYRQLQKSGKTTSATVKHFAHQIANNRTVYHTAIACG